MPPDSLDDEMRNSAFGRVRFLSQTAGNLSPAELNLGFSFRGSRIPLYNPQRGIFKPKQMQYLLSIRTVFPKPGARVWYDDQRSALDTVFSAETELKYAFMGKNPDAADNRWLREAHEAMVPIIYFLGVAPGRYQPFWPVFITGWSASDLCATIAFGQDTQRDAPIEIVDVIHERRYAMTQVKRRLHQASFREAVIGAYGGRCALSGFPEPRLLDAAHIIADGDVARGQPLVTNGLPLSKLHHAAFDAHMIGIDQDYKVHIAHRLLEQHDGPMLESIKQLEGQKIRLPKRERDRPDQERLAIRFASFREMAS